MHLVWNTWDHLPLLQNGVVETAYRVVLAKAHENKCPVLAIGGVEDHVHVLIRLHSTTPIAKVVREMKSGSSHEVSVDNPGMFFQWQGSYGAVSVSESDVKRVVRYIENQVDHHERNYLRTELETITIEDEEPVD